MSAYQAAEIHYLMEQALGTPSGRATIDLSDPKSKEAYYVLLAMHGITRFTRPKLIQTFDEIAAAQQKRKASNLAPEFARACESSIQPPGGLAIQADQEPPISNYREILDLIASEDFKTVQARALDTIVEPAVYHLDTLDEYDSDVENLIGSGTGEAFAGSPEQEAGPKFQIFETDNVHENNPTGQAVHVFGSFYYRTQTKVYPPCLVAVPGLAHGIPKEMTLNDPVNLVSKVGTPVVVCVNRKNATPEYPACDYGPMMEGGNPVARVKLIVNGSIEFNDPIAPIDEPGNLTGEMTVIPTTTHGACPLVPITGATLQEHFHVDPTGRKLVFSWPTKEKAADFGALCYNAVKNNAKWDFVLALRVKTLNKSGVPTYTVMPAFISHAPEGLSTTASVPQIAFQFGCLMAGTLVTMSDGSRIPIEKVKSGDLVASPDGPLRVKAITTGTDDVFVKLSHAGGKSLFVTPGHPIAIAAAQTDAFAPTTVVEADALLERNVSLNARPIDVFWKPQGHPMVQAPITPERVSRAGSVVYNLTLENADGTPLARPERALFYANDILVGDNSVQGELKSERLARAALTPAYHPSGLERIDYENWLAERADRRGASTQAAARRP